jgi:hypothetical protein
VSKAWLRIYAPLSLAAAAPFTAMGSRLNLIMQREERIWSGLVTTMPFTLSKQNSTSGGRLLIKHGAIRVLRIIHTLLCLSEPPVPR